MAENINLANAHLITNLVVAEQQPELLLAVGEVPLNILPVRLAVLILAPEAHLNTTLVHMPAEPNVEALAIIAKTVQQALVIIPDLMLDHQNAAAATIAQILVLVDPLPHLVVALK